MPQNFQIGDRIMAGLNESAPADFDTGRIVDIDGSEAYVAWAVGDQADWVGLDKLLPYDEDTAERFYELMKTF